MKVEAGGRRPELKRSHIFLDVRLQFVDALRRFTCADDHHACCQRVERTGMTDLELLHAEPMAELAAYLGYEVEAGPPQRLVEAEYFAFNEVHQSTITSECPDHRRARMMMPTMMR